MNFDIVELNFEERLKIGARFYGCDAKAVKPTDEHYVNKMLERMDSNEVPTLTSQLSEQERAYLKGGDKAVAELAPPKEPIVMDYTRILLEEDGRGLERLFNIGKYKRLDRPTNRPLVLFELSVPPGYGDALRRHHKAWLNNRAAIKVTSQYGTFWLLPGALLEQGDAQRYVGYRVDEYTRMASQGNTQLNTNWREEIEKAARGSEEFEYVLLVLSWLSLPKSLRNNNAHLMHDKRLFVTYDDKRYRVVGITSHGTLMLSTRFETDEIYDLSVPLDLLEFSNWTPNP